MWYNADTRKRCVYLQDFSKLGLTVHGLQSDQTCDKVIKVNSHVCLGVTQDNELEELVVQIEP